MLLKKRWNLRKRDWQNARRGATNLVLALAGNENFERVHHDSGGGGGHTNLPLSRSDDCGGELIASGEPSAFNNHWFWGVKVRAHRIDVCAIRIWKKRKKA